MVIGAPSSRERHVPQDKRGCRPMISLPSDRYAEVLRDKCAPVVHHPMQALGLRDSAVDD
jgi:hypothetical protein